ncbi:MAG: efflux RND transporter periplasmic adaptor subunit [Flavobacteriales bacterium]|nr:efflux RND transporter periplasmic adaptor subunit [Flavobacteriales bacterium]
MRFPAGAALALLIAAVGCGNDDGTISPTVGPVTESVYASGFVKAQGQYQVYPTATGTVLQLLVKEGDTVKAGQALMRIDDRASGAGERSAAAQVALLERNAADNGPVLVPLRDAADQARDKYLLDSTNYRRQQNLWAQKIGSQAELEQRELAFTTSRAAWVRARKTLAETRDNLRTQLEVARNNAAISTAGQDDRTPSSLIDGIVYDLMIEPGELATPQKPVAVVGSAENLYLELEVDEFDIRRIHTGQQVLVTLDSYGDEVFRAEVSRIIPLMNERSRTFKVEARFTQKPPRLYPNLTAEASIVVHTKENALLVPAAYITDGSYVLTGKDGRTQVKTGLRDMEQVEVLEGITAETRLRKP